MIAWFHGPWRRRVANAARRPGWWRPSASVLAALAIVAGCSGVAAPAATSGSAGSPVGSGSQPSIVGSPSIGATAAVVGPLTTKVPSSADAQYADDAATATFHEVGSAALYVGIWDPQRGMFVRAYGQAVRGGAAATTDDSFRIASVTKTFTATVVLKLVGEGRLALNAEIQTLLPAPLADAPMLQHITLEQLLGMRSGLPDYLLDPGGIAPAIQADPSRAWSEQELVQAATRLNDASPPGTGGYTNTNFVLLGLIAERATGQSLGDLIARRLAAPLGLAHTRLPPSTDTGLPAPAAHGYLNAACIQKVAAAGATDVDPDTDTTAWNTSYFQGAGGMISTVGDLGVWAGTALGTDLLPAALARRRLDVHDIGGDGFLYGLGIKRFGAWYGHDGDAFGWDTLALHNPSSGVSVVLAANVCTGLNDAFLRLIGTLYPDQPTN